MTANRMSLILVDYLKKWSNTTLIIFQKKIHPSLLGRCQSPIEEVRIQEVVLMLLESIHIIPINLGLILLQTHLVATHQLLPAQMSYWILHRTQRLLIQQACIPLVYNLRFPIQDKTHRKLLYTLTLLKLGTWDQNCNRIPH